MQMINKLTPDIKGKAFDPDWFLLRERLEEAGHVMDERKASCLWHKKENPIKENEPPGCCGCGAMYATRDCENCGKTFLDWNARGYDDVVAGPYVTTSGDMYCTRCGPRRDRAEEEREADEFFGEHPDP